MRKLLSHPWALVGIAVSVLFLGLAFWNVDFGALADILLSAHRPLVAAVLVLNFVVIAFKGYRWCAIIGASAPVTFVDATLATLIGYMANAILPARSGELVRVLVLGQRARLSRTMLAGALLVDHLLEGASMVAIMLTLPLLLPTPPWIRTATVAVGAVVAGFGLVAGLLARSDNTQLIGRLPKAWQTRALAMAAKLSDGLRALTHGPRLLLVVGVALSAWLLQAAMLWVCLQATDLQVTFVESLFVLMAINVAALIPGAPSSVGPFEFAAVLALGFLGIPKTPALTAALLYHFVQVLPTVAAGLLALPLAGLGFRDLSRRDSDHAEAAKTAAPPP